LTGERFDHIPDTDGGALDGDAVWDRAVGPMQFIPSTWAEWGTDGSGDGVADPQNIDDAALSAARYLCGAGADLSVSQNWLDAIWSYNGTTEYVSRVSEMATSYATTT
jgi:membrane-bound lytic murein transglycosylase B